MVAIYLKLGNLEQLSTRSKCNYRPALSLIEATKTARLLHRIILYGVLLGIHLNTELRLSALRRLLAQVLVTSDDAFTFKLVDNYSVYVWKKDFRHK